MLRLAESVLLDHVANRIDQNLDEAREILAAVERTPDRVRQQVGPQTAAALAAALGQTPQ